MSNVWRLFRRMDARTSVREKILVAFVLIVLIPSIAIGFFSYRESSSIIQKQTGRAYSEALRQTAINISYRLTEVENISDIVYTNDALQHILRRGLMQQLTIEDIIDDYKSIIEIVHNLEKSRNIFRIRLLVPGDALYTNENVNVFGLPGDAFEEYRQQLGGLRNNMEWRNLGEMKYLDAGVRSIVSLNRLIKDFENVTSTLGVVAIDVEETTFRNVLMNMNLALPYQAMLVQDGELITSYVHSGDDPAQGDETDNIGQPELEEIIRLGKTRSSDGQTVRFEGQTYLYLTQPVENVSWELIVLIPAVNITDQSKWLGLYILLLSGTLIAAAIWLSFLLSGRITKRLSVLADKMKGIEHGHFGETVEISGNDEIALLQKRFNRMSVQIKSLIEEVYTITLNKQREELKVLEGRINSHFLYNTLDAVKWMAVKSKAPEIARVVTDLSKFFRISLNRGKDTIAVERELEHVKAYIDIQNVRFGGSLDSRVRIDPGLQNVEIIKLILQPVVENAIIHGINKTPERQGVIGIRGRLHGDRIVFLVTDNGIGMDRETAAGVLTEAVPGYGLRNVNERLRLYYGSGCGVRIRSRPGTGTVVRLVLKTGVAPR